jgi:hypothetical protein
VLRIVLLTALLLGTGFMKIAGATPGDLWRFAAQLVGGHLGALRGF